MEHTIYFYKGCVFQREFQNAQLEFKKKSYNDLNQESIIEVENSNITVERIMKLKPVDKKNAEKYEICILKEEDIRKKDKWRSIKNAWKPDPKNENDVKKIKGILNKLAKDNYENTLDELCKINYNNDIVIDIIYEKAVNEPFYSELYAEMCKDLVDIQGSISNKCRNQFNLKRNKNISTFIAYLYKHFVISNINEYICQLIDNDNDLIKSYSMNDLVHSNSVDSYSSTHSCPNENYIDIEILCNFLSILNNLSNVKEYLQNKLKTKLPSKVKFMIMDALKL